MKSKPEVIEEWASKLESNSVDGASLEALAVVVDSLQTADCLIKTLLKRQSQSGPIDDKAVDKVLWILEAFADKSPLLGCILILHLLTAIPDELFMHDLYDGTALWVSHNYSPELDRHLHRLVDAQDNAGLSSFFERFIEPGSADEA